MRNYLIKSVLQIIPVLLLISLIVFVLVRVTGDPVSLMLPETASEEDRKVLREALGLDLPIYVQYFKFMGDLLQGDFGTSYRYNLPALPIILERLPASFELAIAAMIIATLISVPLGILSAVKRNSYLDIFITGVSAFGKAIPHFWLGIMLILLFAVRLKVAPVSGRGTFEHLILPALTLGVGIAAEMTRLIRSSMLDILDQDYIRTARSKGLIETLVVCKHAFRNSLIPVVTIMALQSSGLIGGALISETIFAWPGMGLLIVQAVNGRDMAIVQASIFVVAFIVIIGNLIADILYRLLDPRIKYSKKEV